ncbi:MAG TPA: hypothetical protein VIL74_24190 [Pyrinomonadaceae bacterium]|jgi:hypothetical protein
MPHKDLPQFLTDFEKFCETVLKDAARFRIGCFAPNGKLKTENGK